MIISERRDGKRIKQNESKKRRGRWKKISRLVYLLMFDESTDFCCSFHKSAVSGLRRLFWTIASFQKLFLLSTFLICPSLSRCFSLYSQKDYCPSLFGSLQPRCKNKTWTACSEFGLVRVWPSFLDY